MRRGDITRSLHSDYYHPERRLAIKAIQSKWKNRSSSFDKTLNFDERLAQYQPELFYVGLANIESETGMFVETGEQKPEGTCRLFEQGNILYGKLRPYLNKVYIVPKDGQCSTEFYALSAKEPEKLDHSFLSAFLMSKPFLSQTIHMMTGNTHPRIQREDFEEILIPLPPLDIQRALVAEMESARATRQAKLSQADELLKGMDGFVLEQLGLKLPKEEKRATFAIRFDAVQDGRVDPHFHHPTFSKLLDIIQTAPYKELGQLVKFSNEIWSPEQETAETFRYIEISGVDIQTGNVTAVETLVSEAPSRARMLVKGGDILVSLTRPHRGAIAQADESFDGCVASTGFSVVREISDKRIPKDYLWCILRNQICLRQMLQRSSGGNYPAITEPELKHILIPIPSKKTQEAIASELSRRRAEARGLSESAESEWQEAKAKFEKALSEG